MNASDVCHEVKDVPGLYVDAFRGRLLRKTQNPEACFILTHYHGDHYQSLPKEGKYQGPAIIHCSPVTAALLKEIHQVPSHLIAAHEYGSTFNYDRTKITFYDANHCPGACIVLIQLPNGNAHLHTGDMRYSEKFKTYPLLKEVVSAKKLDLVYLDTTYSHPKHDFAPQEQAIETIASQTEELFSSSQIQRVLILLSCYSIGKEKVLWEASTRTNKKLYVSDRKYRMLQCAQLHSTQDVSYSKIIQQCTQNSAESDIHVIPMGLAGEMWPYFRPNYNKCKEYVEKLDKEYDKVVAFLPTGWASASKWNKKNAISKKQVPLEKDGKTLDVEIRLISYSEHSAFTELQDFVQYLRPRKIVPTVFSDDADCRKIQDRFRHLVDSTRAKRAFFQSMEKNIIKKVKIKIPQTIDQPSNEATKMSSKQQHLSLSQGTADKNGHDSDSDIEVIEVKSSNTSSTKSTSGMVEKVNDLVNMGFDRKSVGHILEQSKGNLEAAIETLLAEGVKSPRKAQKPPGTSPQQITDFFSKKAS